jgi:hypothetical protein
MPFGPRKPRGTENSARGVTPHGSARPGRRGVAPEVELSVNRVERWPDSRDGATEEGRTGNSVSKEAAAHYSSEHRGCPHLPLPFAKYGRFERKWTLSNGLVTSKDIDSGGKKLIGGLK